MNITEITGRARPTPPRKRVGRGEGGGWGKTSGRGNKGAGARAGHRNRFPSEGGAFPFFRRIPKVGFNNFHFRTEYQIVNLSDLEARFDNGAHVTAATLFVEGLINSQTRPVKILGDGEIKKKLTVEAQRFSGEAEKKLTAAGCTVTKLGPQPKKKWVRRPPVKPVKSEEPVAEGDDKAKAGKKSAKPEKAPKAEKSAGGVGGEKKAKAPKGQPKEE